MSPKILSDKAMHDASFGVLLSQRFPSAVSVDTKCGETAGLLG
jgi:hypothetical protein